MSDRAIALHVEAGIGGPDPLAWLGDEKVKLIRERKDGYAFWQAEITFPGGDRTKIAFSGDSLRDFEEADGHTIYIEKPELINRLDGLEYNEGKKAWEVDNTEGRIYLEGGELERGGRGEYSLVDGDTWEPKDSDAPGFNGSVDSDAAEVEIKNLIDKQTNVGAKIEWLE